jgi:hypothetical protein
MISRKLAIFVFGMTLFMCASAGWAQNSAPISGTVLDPTGAVVPKATVEIHNPVSGYDRSTATDNSGNFSFANVPFNSYHMTAALSGFTTYAQDVDVRSSVPLYLKISLELAGSTSAVTVEAAGEDLIETTSTEHTAVDRNLFEQLPLESASSSVSSLITLASPGIVADSNGLFHGLGDHAENSFSIDGQAITDQQSKVFSNQIPSDAIQSMEVIEGAPPAEFGDKTSVIIKVTTRSGLGITRPTGSVRTEYGSFGTANLSFDLALGGDKWGNFISANGLNTGRFLDGPEFVVTHDKGNQENVFDRVDFKLAGADTLQLNLGYTRSWFQNPNSFDEQLHPCNPLLDLCNAAGTFAVNPLTGNPLGPADQRSQIRTFNIAPSWTHVINTSAVYTLGAFVRRDHYDYYPSSDPFNDFSSDLQSLTVGQDRTLANAGVHSDLSYVKGVHNIKIGAMYEQTFLTEDEHFGIVDPNYLANNFGCPGSGDPACANLAPYDLTAGGGLFHYHAHTDVKELALFLQDTITKGSWSFNLGIRGDFYNGLSTARQVEPRAGVAYNIKPTSTVLRVSYARTMETPFNENLILSSTGCSSPVLSPLLVCAGGSGLLSPGWRNEFHAGIQQAFGKHFVLSGEYIWKYTHNAYDFSIFGNTPVTFPIEWNNSKIPGFAVRGSFPDFHGLTAFITLSHVNARFFNPQIGGAGATPPGPAGAVFRIDHDEKFEQTTHIQYQPFKKAPWLGFNWRYDSGLVAGPTPFASDTTAPVDLTGLSGDQQMQAGLFCGAQKPTLTSPLTTCAPSRYGSSLIKIPAPGTENDDHNPPRITPRSLFDLAIGDDNLFNGDRYKWSARVTAINVTNKVALYNFLSTFSGTHYVTPRTLTAELGFHF